MTRFWTGFGIMLSLTVGYFILLFMGVTVMTSHAMDRAMVRNTLQINIDREQLPHAQVADVRSDSWQKQ